MSFFYTLFPLFGARSQPCQGLVRKILLVTCPDAGLTFEGSSSVYAISSAVFPSHNVSLVLNCINSHEFTCDTKLLKEDKVLWVGKRCAMRKAQNCTLLYGLRKKSIEVTGSFDEEEVGLNIKGTCQVNPNRTFPKAGGPKTLHGVATV